MRILMIIPELTTGGAQRSFSQLANDLTATHDVFVVVFNREYAIQYQINGSLYSLDVIPGSGWLLKAHAFYLRVVRLRGLKKRLKPDVSISFLEGADYVNVLCRQGDRPIVSVRGPKSTDQDIVGLLGWIRKNVLIPLLYKKAHKVIAVSSSIGRELIENYQVPTDKVKIIGNYYDLQLMHEKSQEELPEPYKEWLSGPILVNVGRLHKGKDQSILIESFAQLRKGRDCKLVIVGDGPMREKLLREAHLTGLHIYSHWDGTFGNHYDIYFLGDQTNSLPFIRRSNLFVFPSLYEGFPNVLVEAMVCRTPILSSQCGGCVEVLGTTSEQPSGGLVLATAGIIVPDGPKQLRINMWVEGMSRYLDSEELSKHYRKHGFLQAEQFKKSKVLAKWLEQIQEVQ